MSKAARPSYAQKAHIKRLVEALREAGMNPAAAEFSPDGHVRLMEAGALPADRGDEFSRWESKI